MLGGPRTWSGVGLVGLLWGCSGQRPEALQTLSTAGSGTRTHQTSPPEEAAAHREQCAAGDPVACHAAGLDQYYAASGPETDRLALEAFEAACDAGYAPSCNGLGVLYQTGRGVEVDLDRARDLFAGACEQGVSTACTHLDLLP